MMQRNDTAADLGPPAAANRSQDTEVSERGEAQVYRRRSLQSRINGLLPLGIVLVLGVMLLGWYYAHVAVRNAPAARLRGSGGGTGEDVPLPSLGRIDPPVQAAPLPVSTPGIESPPPVPAAASAPLAPAVLAPAPMSASVAGQPAAAARSPVQIALERRLSGPAFESQEQSSGGMTGMPEDSQRSGQVGAAGPDPAAAAGSPVSASAGQSDAGAHAALASLLVPTATPAVRAYVLPTQRLLLAKGTFIDCTLETAIDSSLPGMTTCITATDTFSADGQVVLLERGSKLVGETRGEVQQGASRLFVLWTEARTPAGVVVPLASPGTDELGRAGVSGEVERHFWQRFGAAILISVIDGGLQAAARSGNGMVIDETSSSRDVATEALRGSAAIAPTLIKPQGDRIQVLVARDLDFRSVYELKGR